MGSRVLSRSFQVEQWVPFVDDEKDDGSHQAEMVVDGDAHNHGRSEEEHDEDSDDEDHGDSGEVAMVPMADMLNAKFGCNNV